MAEVREYFETPLILALTFHVQYFPEREKLLIKQSKEAAKQAEFLRVLAIYNRVCMTIYHICLRRRNIPPTANPGVAEVWVFNKAGPEKEKLETALFRTYKYPSELLYRTRGEYSPPPRGWFALPNSTCRGSSREK